jgi:putative FmdB family regulatory protein
MPLFEYACRECDNHFELLVRESTKLECPKCSGTHLDKQFSVFATHGGGDQPSFGQTAAGGGCCGGSCGCG